MGRNSSGESILAALIVVGVLFFIVSIGDANEPKCIKSGCDNNQSPGSSYCYLHKPYKRSSSTYGSSSYSKKTTESTTKSNSVNNSNYSNKSNTTSKSYSNSTTKKKTYSNTTNKGTTKKKSYESYDDGYDDIDMDGDYDYDRYKYDSDYADGVDDAMDEFEEDW